MSKKETFGPVIRCFRCKSAKVREVKVSKESWYYCGSCDKDFSKSPAPMKTKKWGLPAKKNGVRK